MRLKHSFFALLLALPLIAKAQPNLVQNGDFTAFANGWTGISAIVFNPHAPNGVFALGPDIYQNIATTPGQQYALMFDAAADLLYGSNVSITISLNSQSSGTFTTQPHTYDPGNNQYDQMQWQQFVGSFTATSGSTRLEFSEATAPDFGLAAVSVVAVPEPTAMSLVAAGLLVVGLWRSKTGSVRGHVSGVR